MGDGPAQAGEVRTELRRISGWAAMLAVPALALGVVAYPDIHQRTMSLLPAVAVLALVGLACLLAGRQQYLILLPLIAAFLPSMQAGFVAYALATAYAVVAFGGARLARPLDAVDRGLLLVLVMAVASWTVNLGQETDLWSLPVFALTFLSPWILLFVARAAPWDSAGTRTIVGIWLALALCQLAPALLKPVLLGMPGAYAVPLVLVEVTEGHLLRDLVLGGTADLTSGSMRSAHHLGAVLLLAVVVLSAAWMLTHQRRLAWLALASAFALLMTDAKHLLLAAVPGGLVLAAIFVWPRLGEISRRVSIAIGVVGVLVGAFWAGPRLFTLINTRLWQPYAALARLNPKVRLIERTESQLSRDALAAWVGFGPGSFASRAATIRATDVLFKAEQQLPEFIPAHTGEAYRATAFDLYTSEIAAASRFRSGALTNPFSSLVGIVAEFGLLGTSVLAGFFGLLAWRGLCAWRDARLPVLVRAAGAGLAFAVPFLWCASLFDSYFEQPDVTAPIMVLALVTLAVPGTRTQP